MRLFPSKVQLAKAVTPLRMLLASSLLVACGGSEVVTKRPGQLGGEARIRTQIISTGGGTVQVTAQANTEILGGSFIYCLSPLVECQQNPQIQQKLVLTDDSQPQTGLATRAAHKVQQIIDTSVHKNISLSATDFITHKQIWSTLILGDTESQLPDQPSGIDGVPQNTPVNVGIHRFNFDKGVVERASQKVSGIDFEYAYAQANLHPTSPKIRAKITNQNLSNLKNNLGVVLGGYALSDSSSFVTSSTAVTLDPQGVISIIGENLKPATVYKMRLHFFDLSDKNQAEARYLGSSGRTYNFVTDGVGDPTARIRARIVARGLAEEYDWDLNRYDRSKDYTHGAGGWCHIFYNWVITPYLKTRQGSENTHYSQSYWSSVGALTNGPSLVQLSQKEPIMGDYFHVGSHAAMILAYDVAKKQFATLEGNFNSSVEFYQRSPGNLSWVGHINQQMLKESAVQPLQ